VDVGEYLEASLSVQPGYQSRYEEYLASLKQDARTDAYEHALELVPRATATQVPTAPSAAEVATELQARLPAPPSASEIAIELVAIWPKPPSAAEVASQVAANLPKQVTAAEVAAEVVANLPTTAEVASEVVANLPRQ